MKTIMLVDDSATILLSISSILSKAGYAVEKANCAAEGLKKFATGLRACYALFPCTSASAPILIG